MPDNANAEENIDIPPIPKETAGAVAGALVGSMMGPVGTVVGGIAGAIAGKAASERRLAPAASDDSSSRTRWSAHPHLRADDSGETGSNQLIIVAPIKIREKRIGCPERIAVPRRHIEKRLSRLVSFLAQERREKREPGDGPIIGPGRYRRLQKDFDSHGILSRTPRALAHTLRHRLHGLDLRVEGHEPEEREVQHCEEARQHDVFAFSRLKAQIAQREE